MGIWKVSDVKLLKDSVVILLSRWLLYHSMYSFGMALFLILWIRHSITTLGKAAFTSKNNKDIYLSVLWAQASWMNL